MKHFFITVCEMDGAHRQKLGRSALLAQLDLEAGALGVERKRLVVAWVDSADVGDHVEVMLHGYDLNIVRLKDNGPTTEIRWPSA